MTQHVGQRKAWAQAYRARIRGGLETCRACGAGGANLTWGHLVARARGGRVNAANVTILCEPCNLRQGTATWGWLRPLVAEPDFGEIVAGHLNVCVIEGQGGTHGTWWTPALVWANTLPATWEAT